MKCPYCNESFNQFDYPVYEKGELIGGNCPNCKRAMAIEDKIENEVPTLNLIEFSEFEPVFENTHAHLPKFDLINKELGLEGKEYYPITKVMNYRIESLRQATVHLAVGKEWCDNRIHTLFVGGAGTGKGILKYAIRQHNDSVECSGARTNLEQLIGKFDKKGNELKGYFRKKSLDVDEAHTLITEEDKNLGGVMREFRIAMDVCGMNTVDKKNVDAKHFLSYCPETRFGFYTHDTILPPVFFDLGTGRRLFAFELKPTFVDEDAAIKGLLVDNCTKELKDYINSEVFPGQLKGFSKEGVEELIFWVQAWNKFCLLHDNQRIRILGRRMFFSGKLYFMRLAMILGVARGEDEISKQTVKQACFDAIHFLLCTLQVYGNKSVLTLSRDIWKTNDQKEAMFLEWLHYQGAVSKEASVVSIGQAQNQIGDIFGINERQTRSVYARLKKAGFVCDSKGRHDSTTWLGFNPNLEEFVDFKDKTPIDLLSLLLRVKWELEQETLEWQEGQRKIENTIRADTTPPSSSIIIVTPEKLCLSNHSNNNLHKSNFRLVDGEPVGKCCSCGGSPVSIAAIDDKARKGICFVCYEGLK